MDSLQGEGDSEESVKKEDTPKASFMRVAEAENCTQDSQGMPGQSYIYFPDYTLP